jgi:hypothetical protein
LPAGKTFDTFDFNAVPMVSKAQVMTLAAGDGWLDQGAHSINTNTSEIRRGSTTYLLG